MGFLKQFLNYHHICIQCHNNPDADALASAYGLYCYFTAHHVQADIVYGGEQPIKKKYLKYMLDQCSIPARYVDSLPDCDLLLIADGQYGLGNVQKFEAPDIAIVDHHLQMVEDNPQFFIDNNYQSCSTIVWHMLNEEHYPVKDHPELCIALLYGLYTDTSSYNDLYKPYDLKMREELNGDYPVLERLKKSCMSLADLMIAGDALHNFYFDTERGYILISAIHCEQAVLGIIGDMAICVDVAKVCLTYTDVPDGYQISIRSCDRNYPANQIIQVFCKDLGNGGGHVDKAGGIIFQKNLDQLYKGIKVNDVFTERLNQILQV